MSKDISTLGKVWLIILMLVQASWIIINFDKGFDEPNAFIASGVGVVVVISIIMMLIGKGLSFLITYYICYAIASIFSQFTNRERAISFYIAFTISTLINYIITYIAIRKTIKKEEIQE